MPNIVSVSWDDHLTFGQGDGRLATPEALGRRLAVWRDDLGAEAIHWRLLRTRIPGHFQTARGHRHWIERSRGLRWDDFEVAPALAHEAGMRAYLYVAIFDEGWRLSPPRVRAVSHHNAMHGRDVAWQSAFSRAHPEYAVVDRHGRHRQWGVLSLAYAEVRRHFIARFVDAISSTVFDGLFVCLRSQSKPARHGDQYGLNGPACRAFRRRDGSDPRSEAYDPVAWRRHLGAYLTTFLRELGKALRARGRRLAIGAPRGDILGPPLGNSELDWRSWVARDLIDELIINQNSSQCPSMWHRLWPMHRGTGYVQSYLDGSGLDALDEQLVNDYAPAAQSLRARVYVARQWDAPSPDREASLSALPGLAGLVFSSFRFDNPEAVARNDWRA